MIRDCVQAASALNAYVDGELEPIKRRAISRHLDSCSECQSRVDALRRVGDLVRQHARPEGTGRALDGLASGVIGRVRAEEAQSWHATFRRALDDWYWAWVAAGSLSAALCSLLFVSALWGFGAQRVGADSLAAMLDRLQTPAGQIWVIATPAGRDQFPLLMEFATNRVADQESTPSGALPTGFSSPNGEELAIALSQAVVRPDGRLSDWRTMSKHNRLRAETLLDEIQHLGSTPAASWMDRRVSIQKLGFIINTSVFGKAL
jgi:hypothetical protein